MEEKLYIGVDGGATKTHLAIANAQGNLLAVHEAGGTYYILENALAEMAALLAPLSGQTIGFAVFTVAGWDFETDQQKQQALIEQALFLNNITVERVVYQNDVFSTLKSAKGVEGACAVISCGTGIIGLAAEAGKFYKTPGYEYLSGEWGSGIHQAEYAIHLAGASLLGREVDFPILNAKALAYFESTDNDSLAFNIVNKFSTNRQRGFFLQHVYDAYHEGCTGAARVIERAGIELAKTAWCLIKKIDAPQVTLVFGGGVINKFGLPPAFKENLHVLTGNYYNSYIVKSPPVYGALKWALQEAGIDTAAMDHLINCEPI